MNSARFFRGWSKEGAGNREMESDVVSALISKRYSATEELTFSFRIKRAPAGSWERGFFLLLSNGGV